MTHKDIQLALMDFIKIKLISYKNISKQNKTWEIDLNYESQFKEIQITNLTNYLC